MDTKSSPGVSVWPKFVEFWLLIIVGFILWLLHWTAPSMITESEVGIIWMGVLIFSIIAVSLDFNAVWGTILFCLGAFLLTALFLIANYFSIPIISPVLHWLGLLDFGIKPAAILAASTVLGTVWLVMYWWISEYGTWYPRPGKMERKKWGGGTEEIIIGPHNRVTCDVPDLMDWLLTFGGGDLSIEKDQHGNYRRLGIVFRIRRTDQMIDLYEVTPTKVQTEE